MVEPIHPLRAEGSPFQGYIVGARIVDACRHPVQAFAITESESERALRLYCMAVVDPTPARRARFQTRLDLLRGIEHERIPRIVRGGIDEGLFWIAVEIIQGASLFEALMSGDPLDPMHVVMMLRDAVVPLRLARDSGVLHGRLTPRRIVTSAAECRAVLEIGFDLLFERPDEGSDVVYHAPEQLEPRGEFDERADIYALGTLAHFALGSPPFEDAEGSFDEARLYQRILMEDLPALSRIRPDCPPELSELVRSMCAKSPNERPRTYEALAERLEQALAACVAHRKAQGAARPPPTIERAPASVATSARDEASTPLSSASSTTPTKRRIDLRINVLAVSALACVAVVAVLGLVVPKSKNTAAVSPSASAQIAPSAHADGSSAPVEQPPEAHPTRPPEAEPVRLFTEAQPDTPAKKIVRVAAPSRASLPARPRGTAIEERGRSMIYSTESP